MNQKSINAKVAVVLAVVVMFLAQMACDSTPTPCANACGVTSPVTEVESAVQRMIQPEQDNILSGGN